jgi:hypothetical protein
MIIYRLALAALLLQQTATPPPPPPPAASDVAGPSMEDTVKFINDSFTQTGLIEGHKKFEISDQKTVLIAPCTLQYTSKIKHGAVDKEDNVIRLDRADPLSTELDPVAGYFDLVVKQPIQKKDNKHHVQQGVAYGHFLSKDLGERVAHAYIHAIVMCHKNDAPSPF